MEADHEASCAWCKGHSLAVSGLRNRRLGGRERRLLLAATPPGELPSPIIPEGTSQADQTATRRAVANLREKKLIWVPETTQRIEPDHPDLAALLTALHRKYAVLRFASRTDVGEAVTQVFAKQLADGKTIRWGINLDDLTEATLARCPHR